MTNETISEKLYDLTQKIGEQQVVVEFLVDYFRDEERYPFGEALFILLSNIDSALSEINETVDRLSMKLSRAEKGKEDIRDVG